MKLSYKERTIFSKMGKASAEKRFKNMTPEERSKYMSKVRNNKNEAKLTP